MKKKLLLLSAILASISLAGCDKNIVDRFVGDLAVTSVSVDPTYATLEEGETLQLNQTVTYKDEQEYTCYNEWRSSNKKIATVSEEGLVTALKPGSVSITYIAGFKSASCSITVPDNGVPVVPIDPTNPDQGDQFSITLNTTSVSLILDDSNYSYQLEATATEHVNFTWSSSDPLVATVDENGLVTAVTEGEAVITASANGVSATCDVYVLPEGGEEPHDDDMTVEIFFFIDYNNVDPDDKSGKKLLAKFWWYEGVPIADSGKVPSNPTTAPIAAFPYFAGWSDHPIVDEKSKLLDLNTYSVSGRTYQYIYGIWTDVQGGMTL